MSIAIAILIALALRVGGFGASAMMVKSAGAVALAYGIPLAGLLGAILYAFGPEQATWARWFGGLRPQATGGARS
jgi:hypothetical protein